MRALVAGGSGMLGQDVVVALRSVGYAVTAPTRGDLDVTSAGACHEAVRGHDLVVNCAAWTAVDAAETQEPQAFAVNAAGAANLARSAHLHGAAMVHVSTDYVFDGTASAPYPVDAPLSPRSAYGRTKAAGEWAVRADCPRSWIVRTAWLYGPGGPNFVATMARLAATRDTITVVDDQRGQPTFTADLAAAITRLVTAAAPFGIYHGTSTGETTWCEFARTIWAALGHDPERVAPVTSAQYAAGVSGLLAPRPAYSVLDHACWGAAGVAGLPRWDEALSRALPLLGLTSEPAS